jgi:hypothetical protein
VRALGNHPLKTYSQCYHDKVVAGALALTTPRSGSLSPILNRFGFKQLAKDKLLEKNLPQ